MIRNYKDYDLDTLKTVYEIKQKYIKSAKTLIDKFYENPKSPDWDLTDFGVSDTIMQALCIFYDTQGEICTDMKKVISKKEN